MSRHVKHEAEDDNPPTKKAKSSSVAEDDNPLTKVAKSSLEAYDVRFSGKPVPVDEARQKWPERYQSKDKVKLAASSSRSMGVESETKEVLQARCHYNQAIVDGFVFDLYDDAYVKGEEGGPDYIAKIVELFETIDRNLYFTAQWFYRADDTVIKEQSHLIDKRRVFYSDTTNDNPLDCIVSKVKIVQLSTKLDLVEKEKKLSYADLYYDDMMYSLAHFSFTTPHTGTVPPRAESDASSISDASSNTTLGDIDASKSQESRFCESMTLLDLYSGCGAMSTGLCLGASISGLKLVNRWAVDINSDASQSLKLNHPQTEVRNEGAEDFLSLLKEWEKLCKEYELVGSCRTEDSSFEENIIQNEEEEDDDGFSVQPGEFEVGKLLAVCYGDPNEVHKRGLYFKVRWRGYGPSDDTWEPVDGLSNCKESIKEFVTRGFKSKILPLPGDVDFICGGPPCQGMSGYNRFRNISQPLNDPKNHQLVVFMDIVEFLKPQYILMENVVDIVKMARGVLGSYAISRLVSMDYQARMGILAAGSFGVPQCRMRFFLWGAHCTKKLPQYPLPTHTFVGKGIVTNEFKEILVGYENGKSCNLEKSVVLKDALYDLPEVTNYEIRDEMPYVNPPSTEFQKYIRLKRPDLFDSEASAKSSSQMKMLYDHIPLRLNEDDYERVCQIPKEKGANFRNLPGVLVGPDNKVAWDPSIERHKVSSGKPLVPDYAMTFVRGTSTKPFGRLWWDEYVKTVVTRAEPHNQVIIHPEQDRVLTVRENARLQGFPDWYKLYGPVKERYKQVGNAVAFPVSIALGHMLAKASQGLSDSEPVTTYPLKFPQCLAELY
ncbi:DNA (cytosine-5)-methyltransferase [Actinidia chinensis var. chinensis]|uniref:Cytosine-specific methyltransferase n=1 Tax=Actinidia chinensis var. chinensis TaxID=1590841 RepID=A0A2R6R557_ACTCC|nr:DNA (cytosine-5)-methyltransferase [Actinidia chinensis var. chinensis]